MTHSLRTTKKQRGVAAVEMALLAGILVLIAFGATELGRAFYEYNTLLKATRAAARELTFGNIEANWPQARNLAVYGVRATTECPPAGCESLLPGLSPALVSAEPHGVVTASGGYQDAFRCVSITGYEFVSFVPLVVPNISFAPVKTCMYEAPQ